MTGTNALLTHLQTGLTNVCRAWVVTRSDGVVLGFTDHDMDLLLDGVKLKADTGLSARAIQHGTGLAVDNSEAVGMLSDTAIHESDIHAGRFDGAEVLAYLVNWRDPSQHMLLFRGTLGEITHAGGAFRAELRGLAEVLNQPRGRVYQKPCTAVLGDAKCRVDLNAPGYFFEGEFDAEEDGKFFDFTELNAFEDRWFEGGRFRVLTGSAAGLVGLIKNDRLSATGRRVELWQSLQIDVDANTTVRLEAGCDKRLETCRLKFGNIVNFQGFPHIPGEDWQMNYPSEGQIMDGGSLFN